MRWIFCVVSSGKWILHFVHAELDLQRKRERYLMACELYTTESDWRHQWSCWTSLKTSVCWFWCVLLLLTDGFSFHLMQRISASFSLSWNGTFWTELLDYSAAVCERYAKWNWPVWQWYSREQGEICLRNDQYNLQAHFFHSGYIG